MGRYVLNYQLREQRVKRGWTQATLAEKLGVTDRTVSRWENGKAFPTPYYVKKLSLLLDASPNDLGLNGKHYEQQSVSSALYVHETGTQSHRVRFLPLSRPSRFIETPNMH